jgi:hypothetical protein
MKMKFPLFKRVALRTDVPKYKLCRGDIATIVEHHPDPDEDGYSLEVFNALGETIAVITLDFDRGCINQHLILIAFFLGAIAFLWRRAIAMNVWEGDRSFCEGRSL